MPSPSYTNADLKRLARISPITQLPYDLSEPAESENLPFNGRPNPELDVELLAEREAADDALAQAKGTLDRTAPWAERLANISNTARSAPSRLPPSLSDSLATVTEPAAAIGSGLLAGSLPALMGGPVSSAALATAGTALSAPDVLRRLLLPRKGGGGTGPIEDESRGDAAMHAALIAAPSIVKGARAGFKAMRAGKPYSGLGPSKFSLGRETTPPAYAGEPTIDPNQVIRVAREVSEETGVPVEQVLKGYTSMGASAEQGSALGRLVGAGKSQGKGRYAPIPVNIRAEGPKPSSGVKFPPRVPKAARGSDEDFTHEGFLKQLESMSVADDIGVNASGESAASAEALSRLMGMKSRGEQFVVRKGGTTRNLIGPDAVDYSPRPGEEFGIMQNGQFRLLSRGGR